MDQQIRGRAADQLAEQPIADAPDGIVHSLKHMYVEGWTSTNGTVLDIEARLAAATPPVWDQLESNRRAVLERNRAQIS